MRILSLILAVVLVVSTCPAQEPAADAPQAPAQAAGPTPAPAPAPSSSQIVVVPQGTQIPATLASPITSKTAKPGRTVRAVTSFPVTIGSQIVIPVGTYFEGVIDRVKKNGRTGPTIEMHFTRIIFANGYTVNVDATNQSADATEPDSGSGVAASFAGNDAPHLVLAAQQTPPPVPHGPSAGIIGAAVGLAAASIVGIIIATHHGVGSNGVLFDEGWQFDLVLRGPLSLNSASITAAAAATSGA
ncbi:MAG TPA: hypothetical protein VMB02_00865 [Candidatus Aquilonibacter sp.]|nr:hypothetical protein [Candidatus Aquilonibacter sp.]